MTENTVMLGAYVLSGNALKTFEQIHDNSDWNFKQKSSTLVLLRDQLESYGSVEKFNECGMSAETWMYFLRGEELCFSEDSSDSDESLDQPDVKEAPIVNRVAPQQKRRKKKKSKAI
eukprot:TRINITY_DN34393_c0_g1_i1.p1 TRINITY_DN34393_c0_g1~~TRINITY_DN34393_c0_g1_i1.p1  ORF type:complete len:117 (+),score=4.05 TRINITY_DN34393_c0_g1_i1:1-351(+)